MANDGDFCRKIDLIAYGVETVGSAERSCDTAKMHEQFYTISNGEYASILFKHFGKERVERELEEFLSHNFFPRCGGGIGVTRFARALDMLHQSTAEYHTPRPIHQSVQI